MNAIAMGIGYFSLVTCTALILAATADYFRQRYVAWKRKKEDDARWARIASKVMAAVQQDPPDWCLPLGAPAVAKESPSKGWISDGMCYIEGTDDAAIINHLLETSR